MTTLHLTPSTPHEHDDFLELLPIVRRHAHMVFHHWPAAHREEAIAKAVASSFQSFCRLKARKRNPTRDFPGAMAKFAVLSVKNGRHVGSRSSSRDVLSHTAQQRRGFAVKALSQLTGGDRKLRARGQPDGEYQELLPDSRSWPVPDRVAFRLDFPAFLKTLSGRDQRLVHFLAQGNSASQAARKFRLTEGRISQIRSQWRQAWQAMHGEQETAENGEHAADY